MMQLLSHMNPGIKCKTARRGILLLMAMALDGEAILPLSRDVSIQILHSGLNRTVLFGWTVWRHQYVHDRGPCLT